MVRAYSNNGSEKGRIQSINQSIGAQPGRIQPMQRLGYDSGCITWHFELRRYLLFGHITRSWNCQPRPEICGRLDLDVMLLLHICLVPDCGGSACGGVGLILDFSPEALLQLSASKAYSKGPSFFFFFSFWVSWRFADSAQRRCTTEMTKTAAQVQQYNGRPEPSE